MTAYTSCLDFRTNIPGKVNVIPIIQEPHEGMVNKINWMNFNSTSEGGAFTVGDTIFLVEGPLPDGTGVGTNLDQNIARDDDAFKAILTFHPTASTATSDPTDGAGNQVGMATFPGGIWTVERMFTGFRSAGGVDRLSVTLGYEKIKVSMDEWLRLQANSPNSRAAATLIQ